MVPEDQAVDQADLTNDVRVYVETGTAATGGRGTAYGTVDHNGITMVAANPAIGDVVRIIDTAFTIDGAVITLEDAASDDTSYGYTILAGGAPDIVHVHQAFATATVDPHETRSGGAAYPMNNFIGAEPVTYAGDNYNGNTGSAGSPTFTALDQTDLYFKSTIGDNTADVVRLIHKAGEYKNICKLMKRLNNCGIYDRAVTVYDLDSTGKETFLSPTMGDDNSLGIIGCWHVPSA
tara:strand:- start:40 stop:744 length:705 start_codon:yes stop_codon:yes gene_type:complete